MGAAVAVTGIGLVTSAGVGVSRSWPVLLTGVSTAASLAELAGLPVTLGCQVPRFDPAEAVGPRRAWRLDRHVQFAVTAAREAVTDAGLDPDGWAGDRVAVVLGNGGGGTTTWEREHATFLNAGADKVSPLALPMSLPNMAAAQLGIDLRARGPNLSVATACASGATAIAVGRDLLRSGAADVVLTGGTEALLTPYNVAAFARAGALSRRNDRPAAASRPFDAERDGFVLGEGAGILVLETVAHARSRGAHVWARLAGCGLTSDAFHVTAPDPDGAGATAAIRTALDDAAMSALDIDHVNAHGTSTPLNDAAEARVLRDMTQGRAVPVTSLKGVLGHALGAAGAIEAAGAVLSLRESLIPPTANVTRVDPAVDLDIVTGVPRVLTGDTVLSTSFGFGGQNAALIFTRP
ncbi:beta-ketoacyl-[acyl-carrier-protein] synthase family protein [Hamadaea tsunoensis]|uniref:beta-ketoacyl-[acyl-carrier-protein] synthase family protein n=1 Tax=Hamadaea tsunoensis TaxID=53368 RepID=UPI00040450EA|nr:beta-ketoacyl-[acyl-carrier-protein] synthase family protein [Hamadaea tsunoensis]